MNSELEPVLYLNYSWLNLREFSGVVDGFSV